VVGEGGGPIIDGIEFDKKGRRVAYWLFTSHPGGVRLMTSQFASVRIPPIACCTSTASTGPVRSAACRGSRPRSRGSRTSTTSRTPS
jgi:capsid protein